MTRSAIILITGANGEVGHGLIDYFATQADTPDIVTLDLHPLNKQLVPLVQEHYIGNILDGAVLEAIYQKYEIDTIFHLAALLSTAGEKKPQLAHDVNVNGTLKLLDMAVRASEICGQAVKFIYPSSIAVYGIPTINMKENAGTVKEDEYLSPTTMYGVNKLYCENLGRYYSNHYMQLDDKPKVGIDFRSVRFPGLISAHTVPSGGTSDYGPEMIHTVAQGKPYTCFVREDAMLPFMAMPDAIQALIQLSQAPRNKLTREVYNVTSFSLRARNFAEIVQAEFGSVDIRYEPHVGRQGIVDTWAGMLDDSTAQTDWDWSPHYDQSTTFNDYLFPCIRERYTETDSVNLS